MDVLPASLAPEPARRPAGFAPDLIAAVADSLGIEAGTVRHDFYEAASMGLGIRPRTAGRNPRERPSVDLTTDDAVGLLLAGMVRKLGNGAARAELLARCLPAVLSLQHIPPMPAAPPPGRLPMCDPEDFLPRVLDSLGATMPLRLLMALLIASPVLHGLRLRLELRLEPSPRATLRQASREWVFHPAPGASAALRPLCAQDAETSIAISMDTLRALAVAMGVGESRDA